MRSQSSAMKFVERAINSGELIRPKECEVCAVEPLPNGRIHVIVAHHWNGYDHPLDVWFVCRSCNRFLAHKHDGSLTKEQAKKYVRKLQMIKLGYAFEANRVTL